MLGIDYGADGFADELTGALGIDGAVYVHWMGDGVPVGGPGGLDPYSWHPSRTGGV
jgi:hypothetical protein